MAYLQPRRGGGVARHAREMICGLAGSADIHLRVIASAPALRQSGPPDWLKGLHCITHPFPETLLERCWKVTGLPPVNLFIRDTDWVYAPAELRLPLRSMRTAITVHDVQAFERGLPWSDTPEHCYFRRKWSRWLPRMLAEVTRIITVSEFTKRRLVEFFQVSPEKIIVIGNGVDPVFFSAGSLRPAGDTQNPRVLVVGGLRTKKGAAATLAVARELKRIGSPIRIDVIGQHDDEWVSRVGKDANVRLHSHLPDMEVAMRLARSVALLFLSPYEGFGLPAVEAMAAGTPAVVANRASLPEIVGSAGIRVEPEEAGMIAETLERLRQDAIWRDAVVVAGKTHAADYTWPRCVDRLLKVFRNGK